jgi:hypothetical protein
MKVKDVIKNLSELDGEQEIVISWWDRECVEDSLGKVTDEAWSWLADNWETNSDEFYYTLAEYSTTTGNEWEEQQ